MRLAKDIIDEINKTPKSSPAWPSLLKELRDYQESQELENLYDEDEET